MDLLLSIFKLHQTKLTAGVDLRRVLGCALLALGSLSAVTGLCQENQPSEYHVEAAFLYHFANFVSWPPQVFPADDTPIRIGVLGENAFGEELETTVRNKTVNGRALQVIRLEWRGIAEAKHCQIVFIDSSERKRVSELLETLKGASVLTVSKMEHFIQSGGMINFVLDDKKVRFEINGEAARRAGLKISAKLLNLSLNKGLS